MPRQGLKISAIGGLMILSLLVLVEGAGAANCGDRAGAGGQDVPCNCGDTVIKNTNLNRNDPVTQLVCPGNGLTVNPGILLECGTSTISGAGHAIGLSVGVGSTVRECKITGFRIGVFAAAGPCTIQELEVFDNLGDGIRVGAEGGPPAIGCTIKKNEVSDNGGAGIAVAGNNNFVQENPLVGYNGSVGITVVGAGNTIKKNKAFGNGVVGIQAFGVVGADPNRLQENLADFNGVAGCGRGAGGNDCDYATSGQNTTSAPPVNDGRSNRCPGPVDLAPGGFFGAPC